MPFCSFLSFNALLHYFSFYLFFFFIFFLSGTRLLQGKLTTYQSPNILSSHLCHLCHLCRRGRAEHPSSSTTHALTLRVKTMCKKENKSVGISCVVCYGCMANEPPVAVIDNIPKSIALGKPHGTNCPTARPSPPPE